MKRGKKLLILLAVLVVLLAVTVAVIKLTPEEAQAEAEDTSVSVFTVDTEAVTQLTWTYEGETLTFVKSDDGWTYAGDSTFPLEESYLTSMLAALSDIQADKTIEAPEDLAQYGLEEPSCTVTVTADTTTELIIGDETGIGGEWYLSVGDGNVYLVDETLIDCFSCGLLDLVAMESIPSMADVTSLTVSSDTQSFTLSYQGSSTDADEESEDADETASEDADEAEDTSEDTSEDTTEDTDEEQEESYVWFWNGDSTLPLDTELTETLVMTVTALSWQQCVAYNAADTLSDYGLDTPTATITVNYVETTQVETDETDEDGNVVYETLVTDASFVLEIGDETGDFYYARIAGSNMVYLIDASIVDAVLSADYDSLSPDQT